MFKIKNNLLLLLNAFIVFTLLGLFLITNNQQVMGMNKDIASASNNNPNITNYSIEENIINLKYKIRENAVKKINTEREIQQLSNNDPKKNTLLALKQNLENLIHNQKEQLKTYQKLLKTLNDENN
uniref:Phytoplasmal effector causing phyllody symptoms 1 n=2 Tax=16SrI (Aster yellows group) TaxID=3042590 RepID=A0A0A8JD20_9MOLU|nr:phytoplasmal effector causing phyllody symptoms 1 [Apricot aster yellows phytoplasma A-AY]BAQ08255.1 phytoplasmal effector causing phyllody symptoms 1 [Apricot chlorotic leafroll phytoplasma AY-A]BDU62076.1 phytoplasmal effector causing phyllody [Apricot aster yellows phytoplasma A-AY]BDU62080.1 phytoplasmal effector causing phyllody [Apricot chlorotic leafroll phytoplasma AY-A]